jgi:hypothetical protein
MVMGDVSGLGGHFFIGCGAKKKVGAYDSFL